LVITVKSKLGAVTSTSVALEDPDRADVLMYASLPHGLLLGEATIADLVAAAGQPVEASAVTEGTLRPVYLLEYRHGADGGTPITFQAMAPPDHWPGYPDQEITAYVCGLRITSADLAAKHLGGASWPAAGLCRP
jgi:hypothetical protein